MASNETGSTVGSGVAEHVACGKPTVLLGETPVLDPDALTVVRKGGDVAGCVEAVRHLERGVGLQPPVVSTERGALQELPSRASRRRP